MCFIFQMFNIQCDWNDFQLLSSLFLSLSLSSLCSPHDRPISGRSGVEARKTTLFRKLAERENGRLMSQNKHLFRVWMPVSFIEHRRGGGEEVKLKRYCKYLLDWPVSGRGCVTIQTEGQGSLRRYPFSE